MRLGGRSGRRTLRRLAALLVLGVVIEFIVLPQLAGARQALHLIADVRAGWLILAVLLEFASLVCYAELTRSLLENVPRIRDVETLVELIASVGAEVKWADRNTLNIHAATVRSAGTAFILSHLVRSHPHQ